MATLDFVASDTPRGIKAELSVAPLARFTFQNLSRTQTIRIRDATAAPARNAKGLEVEPGETGTIWAPTQGDAWLWCLNEGKTAPCVLAPQ